MAAFAEINWPEIPGDWNLGDLYPLGMEDPDLEQGLLNAESRCLDFASKWKGFWERTDSVPQPAEFAKAVREYQKLLEELDRPILFAQLNHAAATLDPVRGALLARTKEVRTKALNHLLFFEMEWGKADAHFVEKSLEHPEVKPFHNWLIKIRKQAPHFLTEPEEKISEVKNLSGRSAFTRLFDEVIGRLTIRPDLEPSPALQSKGPGTDASLSKSVSLQEALAALYDPDRDKRRVAAQGISKTLEENAPVCAFILNTLVLDHREDCRLRKYEALIQPRNLANEIESSVVNALMSSVERNFGVVERHYSLKGKLLGITNLRDYDRYAPLGGVNRKVSWPDACEMVYGAYQDFSPEAGKIVGEFLSKGWVSAAPAKGKRSGAFSCGTVSDAHPYILMSFHGSTRDVATLAHELGHGVHQFLSQGVGYLQASTPLTTAEMASVFGEMLLFERLVQSAGNDAERLSLYMAKVEDAIATVFRQVVLTRFEMNVHEYRTEKGEISIDELNRQWLETNQKMFGQSVSLGEGYKWWWSYIGHFIHSPFYCYSYAFGELLVLSLFKQYKQNPTEFSRDYMRILALGGSRSPAELLGMMGLDIGKADFWDQGISLLDDLQRNAASYGGGPIGN